MTSRASTMTPSTRLLPANHRIHPFETFLELLIARIDFVKHLKYLMLVDEYVEELNRSIHILEASRKDVEERIEIGKRASRKPTNAVEAWKMRVDDILREAQAINRNYERHDLGGCNFSLCSNYINSRRAIDLLPKINVELEFEKSDLKEVSIEGNPPVFQERPTMSTIPA